MKHIYALCVLVCLNCLQAAAQTTSSSDFHELKVYGGYQYTHLDTHAVQDALNLQHILDPSFPQLNFGRYQSLHGWNFGIEEDAFAKWFGVVADVGSGFGTNSLNVGSGGGITTTVRTRMQFYTFTVGPQFTLKASSRIQPFARFLVGGAWTRNSVNTLENNVPQFSEIHLKDEGLAYGGGGGADFFFSRRVGLRVAGDLLRTGFFGDSQNKLRGSAGVIFRF